MPKFRQQFIINKMIKHRNQYTEFCYIRGKKPLLPSLKKSQFTSSFEGYDKDVSCNFMDKFVS